MSEPENESAKSVAPQADPTASPEAPTQAGTDDVAASPPPVDLLAEAKADAAKWREQLLRTAADFDNYRKRARREVDEAQKRGSEDLLKTFLPVFDNLERAAMHADTSNDAKAIGDGVKMVIKQFVDTLARVNIVRIVTVGTPFDPLLHEAIQQIETADQPPGTVVAEVAPGYKLGEKLLRAAMVVVAKPPSGKSAEALS